MIEFIWALAAIILIDVVLGGENALVIALAAKKLPDHLRRRAMIWGTFGAVAVRFACVAALTYLLMIPGLRLVGGLMLIWIAWRLTSSSEDHADVKASDTFWGAMATIVMADAVMGLDNALAIAGAAGGNWWLIIFGLLVSVPIILFGSTIIARVIDRYPDSIFVGAFVLYAVAFKMIVHEPFIDSWNDPLHDFVEQALPFIGAVILTAKQYYRTRIRKPGANNETSVDTKHTTSPKETEKYN
jgi:YjbE family integral membrane protein